MDGDTGVVIGALGDPARSVVDGRGGLHPVGSDWSLRWALYAEDRWLWPGRDVVVRQRLVGHAPVVVSTAREVSVTAYGVPGSTALLEIHNGGALPVAVAVDVTPPAANVTWEGTAEVVVGGRTALRFSRPPAEHDPEVGFVFPLPHRASLRVQIAPAGAGRGAGRPPTAEETVRGWDLVVGRGLAVEVPDTRLMEAVEVARRRVMLALDAAPPASVRGTGTRWGLGSDGDDRGPGLDLAATLTAASDAWTWPDATLVTSAAVLDAVRDLLLHDTDEGLALCPSWPAAWGRGPVDVHRAPTSHGLLSFAVRWHGARPALLWDLEGGPTRLTAPGLDPGWSATAGRGDALLGAVPG